MTEDKNHIWIRLIEWVERDDAFTEAHIVGDKSHWVSRDGFWKIQSPIIQYRYESGAISHGFEFTETKLWHLSQGDWHPVEEPDHTLPKSVVKACIEYDIWSDQ